MGQILLKENVPKIERAYKEFPKQQAILIISDQHVGSSSSRPKLSLNNIRRALQINPNALVIVAGDLYDSANPSFNKKENELLGLLRELAEKDQLVIIRGDHDNWLESNTRESFFLPVYDEFYFQIGKRKFCVIHGHQSDAFYLNNKNLAKVLLGIYYFFQWLGKVESIYLSSHFIYRGIEWSKQARNWWPSWSKRAVRNLMDMYADKDVDVLIIGHLHINLRMRRRINGNWIKVVCTGGSNDFPLKYLFLKNKHLRRKIYFGPNKKKRKKTE